MSPSSTCILLARKFALSFFLFLSAAGFSENPFLEAGSQESKLCSRYRVFLKSPKNQKDIGIKTTCAVKEKELLFSLSMPEGVELTRSNLFEIAGKGESFRTYNLGKKKTEAATLGEFLFEYNGREYRYRLDYVPIIKTEEAKVTSQKEQRLFLGASFASFSITQPEFEAKQSKPGLFLRTLHFPLMGSFGVGALLDLPISSAQSDQSISFSQVELLASFEWGLSDGFRLRPKIGYGNFNFIHDSTNIGMGGSSIIVGLGSDLSIGSGVWLYLDGSSMGLIGSGLKSQYILDLGLLFKTADLLGYGLGVRLQGFSGLNSDGKDRKLSQMGFQGFISF